jgi:hypothetical protein
MDVGHQRVLEYIAVFTFQANLRIFNQKCMKHGIPFLQQAVILLLSRKKTEQPFFKQPFYFIW